MKTLRPFGVLPALFAGAIFAQSGDAPKFEIADVHPSPKALNASVRAPAARNGRYEVRNFTMLGLIREAYGFSADTILGGPNWLELDRFDITAKIPSGASADAHKAMLQSLLEERFKLLARRETKPVATWVLAAGKQPRLKEADSSGPTGCNLPSTGVPDGPKLFRGNPDGTTTAINLGPGGTVQYSCRNMTMAAFAEGLRTMMGVQVGPGPVIDETGLKGTWNFDVRWSLGLIGLLNNQGEQISAIDAIDKQLGLKLEQRPVPKPVLAIESVNRTPTPNPPGLAEALPALPVVTEFEVADVKLMGSANSLPIIRMQMQPGGRFICQGCPLGMLVTRAFNKSNNDQIAGLPSAGIDSVRVDITAKVPAESVSGPGVDFEAIAPLLRSLLADRFKMTYHQEERQVTAYTLMAAKPKMKKSDPESRIFCRRGLAPPGAPPGSQTLTCQNATMAFFAEQLLQAGPGLNWPVVDATGIDGGWDFALTYSNLPPGLLAGSGRGGDAGPQGAALPGASDPGGGLTIFEAIEKQLGLKLKAEKRAEQMTVIDHIEQKPTDN
ncbi:MAG TPA: TIGR03435 family protein [Bryobacteraceae bacterium]|jgi:uncharacterized protein (TIGR03435 family)|nr:TIGR03435 family protein [Bryobacteraceae bacterium]